MQIVSSKPVPMESIWNSLVYKMSERMTDQYFKTGTVSELDVERLNRLKGKRDEVSRSK